MKERLALIGAIVGLVVVIWQGGERIGRLTERLEAARAEIALLRADMRAINEHIVIYVRRHAAGE